MLLWDILFLSSPNIFSNVSSGFHVCLSFIWTLLYHILVPFLKCYACLRGFTCVYLSRSCTTFWYRCPFALGSSILLPLYYTTIIRRPDRILLYYLHYRSYNTLCCIFTISVFRVTWLNLTHSMGVHSAWFVIRWVITDKHEEKKKHLAKGSDGQSVSQ